MKARPAPPIPLNCTADADAINDGGEADGGGGGGGGGTPIENDDDTDHPLSVTTRANNAVSNEAINSALPGPLCMVLPPNPPVPTLQPMPNHQTVTQTSSQEALPPDSSSSVAPKKSDIDHYAATFPARVVFSLGAAELAVAVCLLATQIVLLANSDRQRSSVASVNAAPGVWAGMAAAIAGCMAFLAGKRPTRCTVPACLLVSLSSALLGVAVVGLATYGLVLVKLDGEDADDDGVHLFRIRMHPLFHHLMIKPMVDEARKEQIRRLIRLQLICFGIQLITGIGQVLSGVLLTVLSCRAWRWRPRLGVGSNHQQQHQFHHHHLLHQVFPVNQSTSSSAANGNNSNGAPVLFSTRPTENRQREGFVSIPLPAGIYAVTGDTLERQNRQANSNGRTEHENAAAGEDNNGFVFGDETAADPEGASAAAAAGGVTSSQPSEDPPPKYEDMSFNNI